MEQEEKPASTEGEGKAPADNQQQSMEEAQKEAAEEREEEGGYQ
jgi:hypothetical protein